MKKLLISGLVLLSSGGLFAADVPTYSHVEESTKQLVQNTYGVDADTLPITFLPAELFRLRDVVAGGGVVSNQEANALEAALFLERFGNCSGYEGAAESCREMWDLIEAPMLARIRSGDQETVSLGLESLWSAQIAKLTA